MPIRHFAKPIALIAFAATAVPLLANPAGDVRSRIAGYRDLGAAFKAVNDGLRGGNAQPAQIQQQARRIVAASQAQYRWFPAGSGAQAGVKTAAKPEIWAQAPRFRAAQDAFAAQAAQFQRAAAGGNVDAIRSEARKLGGTCKGCHDTFRTPED